MKKSRFTEEQIAYALRNAEAGTPVADARAIELVDSSFVLIHPFDNPFLWNGHASLVDELVKDGIKPDLIVLSVGGGGLLSGVLEGLVRNGHDVLVAAVETQGTASLAASMNEGAHVAIPGVSGIATSLGAAKVCQRASELSQEMAVHSVVVSDLQALSACRGFLDDHRVVVEPACRATLALGYEPSLLPVQGRDVLYVVCGGATASVEMLDNWLAANC